MHRLPIIAITILLLLKQNSVAQTTIVARAAKDAIYVGANSQVFVGKRNGDKTDSSVSSFCKIYCVNNFNFALAGHFIQTSSSIAKKACEQETSFEKVFTSYANELFKKLKDTLSRMKAFATDDFNQIKKERSITKIIFFGFQKNKPQMTMFDFFLRDVSENNMVIGIKTTVLSDNNIWVVGNYEHIRYQAFLNTTWISGPIKGINDLIRAELKASNLKEENIDILAVTPKEHTWVQKREYCN